MAQVRAGFEATSADKGVAHVGEVITEIDSRVNPQGIIRVHYDRGWLSMKTGDGRVILGERHQRMLFLKRYSLYFPDLIKRLPTVEPCGTGSDLYSQ